MQGKTKAEFRGVAQLVNQELNEWNEDLIRKIFYPNDADMILKLNAPTKSRKGFPAWHYESNGVFFVRSANIGLQFGLAYNLANDSQHGSSSSTARDLDRKFYGNIWNAPVPNKVGVFGWTLAKDNLPTKMNKFRRKLELEGTCS